MLLIDEIFIQQTLDSIKEAIRTKGHFNIIYAPGGSKVDFFVLKDDPTSRQMFHSRHEESLNEEKTASFSKPEDVIVNKLIYYKEGESVKHLDDIKGMIQISGHDLDDEYINEKTKELGLYEIWS